MGAMNNNNLDATSESIDSKDFQDQFLELRHSNESRLLKEVKDLRKSNESVFQEKIKELRQSNDSSIMLLRKSNKELVSNKMPRGRKTWTESEVSTLLDVWKENDKHLRSLKRNSHIYEKIAQDLREQGISANSNEVHFKINNLKQRYRKEESFGVPSSWTYFQNVKEIFENFKKRMLPQQAEEEEELEERESTSTDVTDGNATCTEQIPIFTFQVKPNQKSCTTAGSTQNKNSKKKIPARLGRPPGSGKNNTMASTASKRGLSFKKEMLIELRRANDIAERNHAQTEELLREANEINKEWIKLMKEFLDKSLHILEHKVDIKPEPTDIVIS